MERYALLARAQAEGLFNSWIQAFNAQLAARAAGDSRVVVVDFYTNFKEQVENPAQFGLTNAKNTACPPVGVGTDGLPVYNFATCTATALASDPRAAAGGALWWQRAQLIVELRERLPGTPRALAANLDSRPAVAVLPFDNLSGDPSQDYFSDGLSEDIITDLARNRELMVIARNSTFAFKDQPTDIRDVGASLGARYVVEGSARRAGDHA